MTKIRELSQEDVEEFAFATAQAELLSKVLEFLEQNDAPEELIGAVEQAITDNDFYLDPSLSTVGAA